MAQAAGQVRRLALSRELVSASPAPEEQECPAAVYWDREYQTREASSEPFEEAVATRWVPLFYNFRGQGSCSTERRPCTYSEPADGETACPQDRAISPWGASHEPQQHRPAEHECQGGNQDHFILIRNIGLETLHYGVLQP
jgi:hypothetical protein